ncbi:hypothetical protein C1T17_08865 [Sphingobium sp. SCG-1]|nr:hypothetical protein C1T17_08865 [Sphingobium sp. SCG-1]
MGWKIFAVVNSVMFLSGVFSSSDRDVFDVVGTVVGLAANTGLVLYAFNKRLFSRHFWRFFSWALTPGAMLACS